MKEDHNTDIFPKRFFWGASTAGHQVEGGNHNQWSVWETQNAKQLAQTAHQRLSWLPNWNEVKKQAEAPENYISGAGVEHYERYQEDFDIIKKLNLNAFRFGIEWARIEPREGEWDEAEVAHYREYIAQLRKRGIEPFANIWHWTVPVWFADKGGFARRQNRRYFERFIQKLADELVDDLGYIITLNEPNVYASFGYLSGEWVPNQRNPWRFLMVYKNLFKAHRAAYKILKKKKPSLQIGIAQQLGNIQAKRPHNLIDQTATRWMRYFWNWWFLNRIRKQQDFVGINYYFTDYYTGMARRVNPSVPVNDLGWYMEPEGLYPLLLSAWNRYKKPIFVTENGLADAKDEYRRWWLEETIVAMERALSEGVELHGYLHWSLLDNFEWKYGWWPQFGLVHVDRHTMKRTIRPSAKWFAKRIKDITKN
ncbi:glycoside hydrolase family 1 protein [Candidatus Saccharibacteria bacterium]|nr:glycoside hydrolase family 1 protein [Candidatus Saccharibacteria bacterium]